MNNRASDRYGTLSADMEELIRKSKDSIGEREMRKIRCPRCRHILMDAYDHADVPLMIICKKCKEEVVIKLAFFRTSGKRRRTVK